MRAATGGHALAEARRTRCLLKWPASAGRGRSLPSRVTSRSPPPRWGRTTRAPAARRPRRLAAPDPPIVRTAEVTPASRRLRRDQPDQSTTRSGLDCTACLGTLGSLAYWNAIRRSRSSATRRWSPSMSCAASCPRWKSSPRWSASIPGARSRTVPCCPIPGGRVAALDADGSPRLLIPTRWRVSLRTRRRSSEDRTRRGVPKARQRAGCSPRARQWSRGPGPPGRDAGALRAPKTQVVDEAAVDHLPGIQISAWAVAAGADIKKYLATPLMPALQRKAAAQDVWSRE